jgi:hypothetical protein
MLNKLEEDSALPQLVMLADSDSNESQTAANLINF